MTTTDRTEFAAEIADIRDELAELQTRLERVMRDVRHLPGGDWLSIASTPARASGSIGIWARAKSRRRLGWPEVAAFLEDEEDPAAG